MGQCILWAGKYGTFNYGCRYISFHTKFSFPEVSSYVYVYYIEFNLHALHKDEMRQIIRTTCRGSRRARGRRRIYFDIAKFQNYSDQKRLVCDMDKIPQQAV
jgi:hypothetical protein